MSSIVRPAVVAGSFYPDDPEKLSQMLISLLEENPDDSQPGKAFISPHAGYIYSGPTAAHVFNSLNAATQVSRVVLLGPAHYVYVSDMAVPSADYFATPLGKVELDTDAIKQIAELLQVVYSDKAHAPEHSLEVQLPFLQMVFPEFKLVPILVGEADPESVAQVLDMLWGGDETLILVSSDLSHFHDYDAAREIDRATAQSICDRREDLHGHQACGCHAINGLMRVAKQRDMSVTILHMSNSGDTSGVHDRVVGYGAYVLN